MRKLTIAGQAFVFLRKWSISEVLGSRTTFSCTVLPPGRPQLYQPIILSEEGNGGNIAKEAPVFEGIITKIVPQYDGSRIVYNVSAADYSRLADYRLASFAAINMTAEDIVTEKLLPLLAQDGISAGTISANVTIKKAVFNFCKVSDALTQLATLCGGTYTWYIKDKRLHFCQRSQNESSYQLTDSGIKVDQFKYTASSDNYRNIQYIKGAKGWTAAQTETLTVDGKEYTTRYPVALQPSISVNGVPATVGVSGLNDGTADFFWSYDSRTITCNLETAPGTISITYIGLMTIYTRKASQDEIRRIAALSGGSGIRESLYADDTIDTQEAAAQYCDALLQKYAKDAEKISFIDSKDHWHVGELVYVFRYDYLIMGYYLVTERKIRGVNADDYEYELTLSGGSEYDGWIRFFDELAQRPAGSVINADEIAAVLEQFDEAVEISGAYRANVVEYPLCGNSVIVSNSLMLGTIASSDTIGD